MADLDGGLAGRSPGVGALQDDAELVAGQCPPPGQVVHPEAGPVAVAADQLVGGREPVGHRLEGADPTRGGQEPCQVEAGVAQRGQLPVQDRCQFRTVVGGHDVGQVVVAVDDPEGEVVGAVRLQPVADTFDSRQVRTVVAVERRI